jgi:Ca-activated chloride channel family protein
LADNDPQQAARLFKSPQWQGVAEYRAGNYEGAAAAFSERDGADDNYNRGNALAMNGQLEEALKAYDQALQLNPDLEDAKSSKEVVEKLLQQKKQQQPQGKNQKPGSGDSPQGQKKGGQGQDQQAGDQNSQSQVSDQHGKDQSKVQNEAVPSGDDKNFDPSMDKQQGQKGEKDEQVKEGEAIPPGKLVEEVTAEKLPPGKCLLPEDKLTGEQQQALEQWLRKIPDNPGGLLKRKFEYQYRQNQDRDSQSPKKIW